MPILLWSLILKSELNRMEIENVNMLKYKI